MWFGIIVFAMSNGFILVPVVLSFVGPINTKKKEKYMSGTSEKEKQLDGENSI